MKAFFKKIGFFLLADHTTGKIEQLQIKKQQLEKQLQTLDVIEKELIEAKKITEEPHKESKDAE